MSSKKKSLSLAKEKIKVLLLEGLHNNALQLFDENGYNNIEYLKGSPSKSELIELIKDIH